MHDVAPMLSAFRSAAELLAAAVASGQARPLEVLVDTYAACQQEVDPNPVTDCKLAFK